MEKADETHLAPQTAIVTGASGGLGFHCALNIAQAHPHWRIILACRSPLDRALAAADTIRQTTGNEHVEVLELDLASLDSVRRFVDGIVRHRGSDPLPPISTLVCNAGLQVIKPARTVDGFEVTFGTNHLGHFLLVNLLLKALVDSSSRDKPLHVLRIVNVASGVHDPLNKTGMPAPRYIKAEWLAYPEQDVDDPVDNNSGLAGRRTYSTSKLCNILFTYELARRLKAVGWGDRVHVTAYDPGFMPGTGLARDYHPALQWLFLNVLPLGAHLIQRWETPERSGRQLARLASDVAFAQADAQYFVPSLKDVPSSDESYDEEKQRDLWETSCRLVQLTADETPFADS